MKEAELAYIAGLVDGEGYIGIRKASWRKYHHLKLLVQITNSDREVIEWINSLARVLVGAGYIEVFKGRKGRRDRYTFKLEGMKSIKQFLQMILPYLRIKKKQAELVLRFISVREKRGWTKPYSDEEYRIYNLLKEIIHSSSMSQK
jgi:hypothetical protein